MIRTHTTYIKYFLFDLVVFVSILDVCCIVVSETFFTVKNVGVSGKPRLDLQYARTFSDELGYPLVEIDYEIDE